MLSPFCYTTLNEFVYVRKILTFVLSASGWQLVAMDTVVILLGLVRVRGQDKVKVMQQPSTQRLWHALSRTSQGHRLLPGGRVLWSVC
jgi:hypothetical protein